jgi:hypothetical protein
MVLKEIKNRIVKSRRGSAPGISSVYSVRPILSHRGQYHDAVDTGETVRGCAARCVEGLRPSGLMSRNAGATPQSRGH